MATDPLAKVRNEVGAARCRDPRGRRRASRRSTSTPGWMRSGSLPRVNGLAALEGLARALGAAGAAARPSRRDAVAASSMSTKRSTAIPTRDCTAILAALAVRLH